MPKKTAKKTKNGNINPIDENSLFATPEGISLSIPKKKYLCLSCILYDGKANSESFEFDSLEKMFEHQKTHFIKAQADKKTLRDMTPYSKYLLHLKNSESPMIFRFIDEKGMEIKSYFPQIPLPIPTSTADSFASVYSSLGDERVVINIMIQKIDTSNKKFYSLPDMISQECMECPHCFKSSERKIVNKNPLDMKGIKVTQDSIFLFKCDIDLCPGIKNSYSAQHHIIEWTDQLIDLCLDKKEDQVKVLGV